MKSGKKIRLVSHLAPCEYAMFISVAVSASGLQKPLRKTTRWYPMVFYSWSMGVKIPQN